MAKVTVYVTDDQLEKLKAVKGVGRGGVSKLFQAFVDSAVGSGAEPAGRYDYSRKLMPIHAAIERHRRRLARKVQTGGPPADGGPVSEALTVLLYRRLLEADPSLGAAVEKEFSRFGLDELVAAETEGIDLLAEPEEDEEIEEGEEFDFGGLAGLGNFGIRLGDEIKEAMRQVQAIKVGLRDIQGPSGPEEVRRRGEEGGRRRSGPRHRERGRRGLHVEVSATDDPRDLLTVSDFATFQSRHSDWDAGSRLTPSQMETVRELLITRAGGDPEIEDTEIVDAETGEAGADDDAGGDAAAEQSE